MPDTPVVPAPASLRIKIASALANWGAAQTGIPPITNVLEMLRPALREKLLSQADWVIDALELKL